jgi:hypothetical protein
MSHRLRALAVNTWSPEDQGDMHRALDPAGVVVEPAHTEVRFADGLMLVVDAADRDAAAAEVDEARRDADTRIAEERHGRRRPNATPARRKRQ